MDEFTKRRIANMGPLYGHFDLTANPGAVDGLAKVYQTTLSQGGHLMRFYQMDGAREGVAAIIPVGRCYIVAHVRGVTLDEAAETFRIFLGAEVKQAKGDAYLVGSLPDIDALPHVEPYDCANHSV